MKVWKNHDESRYLPTHSSDFGYVHRGRLSVKFAIIVVVCLNLINRFVLCNGDGDTPKYTNESLFERPAHGSHLVWSEFLEDYLMSQSSSNRNSKDLTYLNEFPPMGNGHGGSVMTMNMQNNAQSLNYHSSAYKRPNPFITKRIGEAAELEPHMRPPIKVNSVNGQFRPMNNHVLHQPQYHHPQTQQQPSFLEQLFGFASDSSPSPSPSHHHIQQQPPQLRPVSQQNGQQGFLPVSQNDLYFLGAIEKLVYRVDYLESRIRRSEQLIYYLMSGNNQKDERDPCAKNFTRISDNCYHISSGPQVNWKAASSACKNMNANLAEFEGASENEELIAYLLNQPKHRGRDFWLGGLNPGLIWIWSNSAKPVNPVNLTSIAISNGATVPDQTVKEEISENEAILNNVEEIQGKGRCLRLTYNAGKHTYIYYGQECTSPHYYICEYEDKTLDNKIKKLTRDLKL